MAAYYNENDPKTAAWLRELIKAGLVADGYVDERSIELVQPDDVRGFAQCHFFAGIGGWSYALRLAGWSDYRPVWTGSCPCQPFSAIGKRRGESDTRHLWPDWYRLVSECRPAIVFGEQVVGSGGLRWLAGVRSDLEGSGYAVGAADLCAACVGSPTRRQRLYFVAHAERSRLERFTRDGYESSQPGRIEAQSGRSITETGEASTESAGVDAMSMLRGLALHNTRSPRPRLRMSTDRGLAGRSLWSQFDVVPCVDGWRRSEPSTFPLAHGVPARVGRLRGYGNAIVPQVAAAFIAAAREALEESA